MNDDEPKPLLFEAVLRPHRSLPRSGFFIVMMLLAGVSFSCGVAFVLLGAWPVTGFFGLDVLLLYWAFRINYRAARERETLRLAGDEFTVERINIRGEGRFWRFQPYWLRVLLVETAFGANRLFLRSHGRSLAIAGFVGAGERRVLASNIEAALRRYREGPPPGDSPSTSAMP